jgi:amino acid transporter
MPLVRSIVHPEGWLAGFRASFGPAAGLILAIGALIGAEYWHQMWLGMAGILLAVAAVVSGVAMAYAAGGTERRRTPQRSQPSAAGSFRGDDVLAIIEHIDRKVDDLKAELLSVIREGREAHTREHADQQLVCRTSMEPLQTDFLTRQRARNDREARVGPLVAAATWATNHWIVFVAILGAVVVAISYIGSLVHG